MAHRDWLPWQASVFEQTLSLGPGLTDGRAVARALMENHRLWGDLAQTGQEQGVVRVRVNRPGTVVEAWYHPGTGETR